MRSNRFWFIAMVAIAFSVQGQDARSQPVALVRVDGEASEAEVDLSDLTLAEAETFERLRDGISVKWNEAIEKHRQLIHSYMDLRFQDIERMSVSGQPEFRIDPARYRRLKLAQKGAIDRYLQEKHTQPADWYEEQAKVLFIQLSIAEVDLSTTAANDINYATEFSQDVDSVLTTISEIESSPLLKSALASMLTEQQRKEIRKSRLVRATATQEAYLQFMIALIDQRLLLTLPQRTAFKNLIDKHRPKITDTDLDELDDASGDLEEAITTLNAIPAADLRKILSPPQVQLWQDSLGEFGIGFEIADDNLEEAAQFDLRNLDAHLQAATKSLLKAMSEMAPPVERAKLAEAQARRFVRRFMAAELDHVKTVTQMSVADQVRFDAAVSEVIDGYIADKFKPIHDHAAEQAKAAAAAQAEPLQPGNVAEVDHLAAQAVDAVALANDAEVPDAAQVAVDGELEDEFDGEFDLSQVQSMIDDGDFSAAQTVILEITKTDAWKQALAKLLTSNQRGKLRTDKFRRYIEPRDAYAGLMVFWMDRAMYLTPEKRDKLIDLARQNQKPVTAKLVEDSDMESVWMTVLHGLGRVPDAELEKLLSPAQLTIGSVSSV